MTLGLPEIVTESPSSIKRGFRSGSFRGNAGSFLHFPTMRLFPMIQILPREIYDRFFGQRLSLKTTLGNFFRFGQRQTEKSAHSRFTKNSRIVLRIKRLRCFGTRTYPLPREGTFVCRRFSRLLILRDIYACACLNGSKFASPKRLILMITSLPSFSQE